MRTTRLFSSRPLLEGDELPRRKTASHSSPEFFPPAFFWFRVLPRRLFSFSSPASRGESCTPALLFFSFFANRKCPARCDEVVSLPGSCYSLLSFSTRKPLVKARDADHSLFLLPFFLRCRPTKTVWRPLFPMIFFAVPKDDSVSWAGFFPYCREGGADGRRFLETAIAFWSRHFFFSLELTGGCRCCAADSVCFLFDHSTD